LEALRCCAITVASALQRLTRPIEGYGAHPWRRGFPWIDAWQRPAIAAAVIVALFVLGMIFIDAAAIRAVGRLSPHVVAFFQAITDYGKSGWFLWPLGLLFLALAAMPRKLTAASRTVLAAVMVRTGFLFVAIGAPGLFAAIVKNMIGRARPLVGGSLNPYLFEPFHWAPAYASLPSGHSTAAFAALAAFTTLWPRLRTVFLVYAVLIAVSRIVVTAHYPTDVAMGAVVGIVGVVLIRRWFALQRLGFAILPDGNLRQFPGPSAGRIKSVARELLA
jgi:undecaprenyl-diphosphatase